MIEKKGFKLSKSMTMEPHKRDSTQGRWNGKFCQSLINCLSAVIPTVISKLVRLSDREKVKCT